MYHEIHEFALEIDFLIILPNTIRTCTLYAYLKPSFSESVGLRAEFHENVCFEHKKA